MRIPALAALALALFVLPYPLSAAPEQPPGQKQWPSATAAPPSSSASCTIRILPVRASTLDPLPAGFQFAFDPVTTNGQTAYHAPHAPDGGVQFEGSPTLRELRPAPNFLIETPPARFTLLAHNAAADRLSTAIIYRQCFHPVTTLVLVINDDTGAVTEWRYAKSGRFSRLP